MMKLLLENWRNYLNEGIDPEIIEHIRKTIEERVEIPVSKMYLLENSTVLVHLQVDLNEHSSELMPLIHERWENSDELKQIKDISEQKTLCPNNKLKLQKLRPLNFLIKC